MEEGKEGEEGGGGGGGGRSYLHHEDPGSHIPWFEPVFPEPIHNTCAKTHHASSTAFLDGSIAKYPIGSNPARQA